MHSIVVPDPIHLIGIGCGGSYTAENLAKRGKESIKELHAYDRDDVDESNTRSQTYVPRHVGMKKVDALAEQVHEWGGIELIRHPYHVESRIDLSGYVFVAVDSMDTRMKLWEESIEGNERVKLMVEMRLDTTSAIIHAVEPKNRVHCKKWRHYWYPDSETTTAGSCGAAVSMGPIASLAASLCVWQMIRHAHNEKHDLEARLDNQIRIGMVPMSLETFQW